MIFISDFLEKARRDAHVRATEQQASGNQDTINVMVTYDNNDYDIERSLPLDLHKPCISDGTPLHLQIPHSKLRDEFEILEVPGSSSSSKLGKSLPTDKKSFTLSTLDLYQRGNGLGQRNIRGGKVMADSVDGGLDLIYRDNATSFDDLNSPSFIDGRPFTADPSAETSYYSSTGNELDNDNVFSCPEGELFLPSRRTENGGSEFSDTPTGSNSNVNYLPRGRGIPRSRSGSSDSVLDRCSDSDLVQQLAEMEQQLMSTKLEMARLMNRETCFKDILDKRDSIIGELDVRLEEIAKDSETRKSSDRRLKEDIRELQNQNRFLNEEVKKLTHHRQKDQSKFFAQNMMIQALDSKIESWKRDYVFLLQSCITVPTGDMVDGMEVNLHGGNTHKERIKDLLEEARKTNPGLPTYDRLSQSEEHIDQYGFRHSYNDKEGLLLHYLCQQLHQHYLHTMLEWKEHQAKWKDTLRRSPPRIIHITKESKLMGRMGIPSEFRQEVWKKIIYTQIQDIIEDKGPHYYNHLVNSVYDSQLAGQYRKQINLDLLRTMPYNVSFSSKEEEGIRRMREVLQAFSMHSPEIGYCQGLNFIVGMCLLILETEDAFWALVAITEKYFTPIYFDHNLTGALADQEVMRDIMKDKLPKLYRHLCDLDIEISTVTLNWFLAIFFDSVPFEVGVTFSLGAALTEERVTRVVNHLSSLNHNFDFDGMRNDHY
ncbi:hypothetical protein CAPTEDRAFT_200029 [Capitella teleta]|uniref:Rab-GAP TBC domain-containing protein n=1 Tax=Capitella teleta TaxID=283909 RepID=R7UI12_CAPTE|nr:hypothetical protein CAPTEDRAFT_200029 [Capitella teleta]|eukprot:ELU05733.1 hypothetical protein CAPTEDRAFT_200029 [Capitella teleta]